MNQEKPIKELCCTENGFNVFAPFFFSQENITAMLLLALQVNQIYLANQYCYPGVRKECLGHVQEQKCSKENT